MRLHSLKLKSIVFTVLIAAGFSGCDVVPYKEAREIRPVDPPDTTQNAYVPQNVLIEDYTGHTCGNCPSAAREAKKLADANPGRVFVMAVHAGFFAKPKAPSAPSFTEDFRTPAGDALDAKFNVSTAGLPKGVINRRRFGGSKIGILSISDWVSRVSLILGEEPLGIKIELTPTFYPVSRQVQVKADVTFQKAYSTNLKMAMYLTEDSIVNWQKEYDKNFAPPEDQPNYVHMHVLRTNFNPLSGTDVLNEEEVKENSTFSSNWNATLAAKIKQKNCRVILILFNAETDEIVQVLEEELIKN